MLKNNEIPKAKEFPLVSVKDRLAKGYRMLGGMF
jgi:hypothetical protein